MTLCSRGFLLATCAILAIVKLSLAGYACLSNPCQYGICMDELNSSYTCFCIDGYTGTQCQTNWNECWSSPCMNGGTCQDGVAIFNCSCPEGFKGSMCEENVNECNSNPCLNNSTCVDNINSYSCQCLPGYSGVHCEIDIAVCNLTGEARCFNGGECREGPGELFTCICLPGWSGTLCEIAINECESAPCQNGAICVDLEAHYACACLFGYTGQNCEVKLHPCVVNPCENGALCLVEEDIRVCYCVPDFHGDRCQYQYDECQLGPRCMNGGTCLDGVDNFTCSCPPDLTGSFCECLILDSGQLDCTYIRTTSLQPLSYSTSTSTSEFSRVYTSHSTLIFPVTKELQTTSTLEENVTSLTSLFPPSSSSTYRIPKDASSSSMGTTDFETISFTAEIVSETLKPELSTEQLSSMSTAERETSQATESSGITSSEFLPTRETSYPEINVTAIQVPSESSTEEHTSSSPVISFSSVSSESTTEPMSSTEEKIFPLPFTTVQTSIETTSMKSLSLSTSETITSSGSTAVEITNYTVTDKIITIETNNISFSVSLTTALEEESSAMTSFSSTTAEYMDNATSEVPDCRTFPCLNDGICVHTKSGPRCSCKFGWEGALCEEPSGIRIAAFTGQSYLTHRLTNISGAQVELVARTLSPSGMLLFGQLDTDMYICLFVEEGLLRFQFSCGIQTMLFSEVQIRVNNGYDLKIQVGLEILPNSSVFQRCLASLRINNTLAMSGEQIAILTTTKRSGMWLHLGGIPPHFSESLDVPNLSGFTGCMQALKVDNKSRHIFKDAADGYDVSECASLACLSNPCYGSATCIENKENWNCLCPSGYVGVTCEHSVCENNPCQFGGTCVIFPGSGFLCLCPLGKHGIFCENDLDIGQPAFFSSVGGLASYAAYTLPGAIHNSMELKFRFVPSTIDQISLMVFVGQEGYHDSRADHLSVSFIKGYIVLTWNLGSGPRRIFTPQPVTQRASRPHTVRLGRIGQSAWLLVDNMMNVTGRSPGRLTQLNTQPVIYLGGHESRNFSLLPHDLPLHTGFSGCLFGVELRAGRVSVPLQRKGAATGRSVGQCGTTECHEHTCQHNGACIHHGATFTCLCSEGWYGPVCAQRYNPCDSNKHKCYHGSTCVPLPTGYECDCPLGKTGRYCEKEEKLSDVLFSGRRSYLSLMPAELKSDQATIKFDLKPHNDRGLIFYMGKDDKKSFLSVSLQGGMLEVRVLPGKSHKRSEPLVIRSRRMLALNEWHNILAGYYGRHFYLQVDGNVNTGALLPGEKFFMNTFLHLGGISDFSLLPAGTVSGLPVSFSGCIRQLYVNWRRIMLNESFILKARNIADCDGTPCGGDICDNGGSCWLDKYQQPRCICTEEYRGDQCDTQVSCMKVKCQNEGRCVRESSLVDRCHCPVGWGGAFCTEEVTVGSPHFRGDGYLMVESSPRKSKREGEKIPLKIEVNYLYLNFSTIERDGMILWSGQKEEFIGIGVEQNLLKLVWALEGSDSNRILVSAGSIADGAWHNLEVSLNSSNVTLWVDQQLIHSQSLEYSTKNLLTTDGIFYLGGFPEHIKLIDKTNGYFKSHFHGCVKEFSYSNDVIITDFSGYKGENVQSCYLLQS